MQAVFMRHIAEIDQDNQAMQRIDIRRDSESDRIGIGLPDPFSPRDFILIYNITETAIKNLLLPTR